MKNKNKQRGERMFFLFVTVFLMILYSQVVVAQGEVVGSSEARVCCEETNSGLFCQEVPETDCQEGARAFPTACSSTTFCKPGFCFDSSEGTCLGNVPQMVCNEDGGTWTAEKPLQCELGCCILGDQPSFVTLTRCRKLSSYHGLETNYDSNIDSATACILTASASEKGACVFLDGFDLNCKMTTRGGCTPSNMGVGNSNVEDTAGGEEPQTSPGPGEVEFNSGMLCSADVLGTICGESEDTACLPGREEVYFVDTCGNPANVYDSSKLNDDDYWSFIKDKSEACRANAEDGNANSQSCGNCNYILGSVCRESGSGDANPTYGDNVCVNLNCVDESGKERLHGESWCSFDVDKDFSPGVLDGDGKSPVGSRYHRNACINGEVKIEPCADFRQEECIENVIETGLGDFSEAACRVNRWQDCTAQKKKFDCTNTNQRDCKWLGGIGYTLMGGVAEGSSVEGNSLIGGFSRATDESKLGERDLGACVPENAPGLNYWTGEEAKGICSQASAQCVVTFEKKLVGGDWECTKNCECLPGGELEIMRADLCVSLGDCGPKINYVDKTGRGTGFEVNQKKLGDD